MNRKYTGGAERSISAAGMCRLFCLEQLLIGGNRAGLQKGYVLMTVRVGHHNGGGIHKARLGNGLPAEGHQRLAPLDPAALLDLDLEALAVHGHRVHAHMDQQLHAAVALQPDCVLRIGDCAVEGSNRPSISAPAPQGGNEPDFCLEEVPENDQSRSNLFIRRAGGAFHADFHRIVILRPHTGSLHFYGDILCGFLLLCTVRL